MKVQLHCHTSRYSACATVSPDAMMTGLTELGYAAVYITEHDYVWGVDELAELQGRHPRIRIFPGVERSMGPDAEHIVILGTQDPEYLGLRHANILQKARDEGHLVVLAHPFRWNGADGMLRQGLLPDAIEYQTCNHAPAMAEQSLAAAARLHLPLVNSADAHSLAMAAQYWIETEGPLDRADDIRRVVLEGKYKNCAQ